MTSRPRQGPYYLILAGVGLGIILLDQATKAWIHGSLRLHESIEIAEGFFAITYIRNPGAAFGLLANLDPRVRFYFFVTVSCVALVVLGIFFSRTPRQDRWTQVGLSSVCGGAVGNLIDRLRFGEVIDFMDFSIGTYHWPAFNVADSAISIGLVLLVLQLIFRSQGETAAKGRPLP